jgi:DNA-binding XRE family transcriptional regulator
MTKHELRTRRLGLGKTQRQMAGLLGVSIRAIQSFEQGWRKIPDHVERQVFLLVMLARRATKPVAPCWTIKQCPVSVRKQCPAWELKAGHLCWFIPAAPCRGIPREWKTNMAACRRCEVFLGAVGPNAVQTGK